MKYRYFLSLLSIVYIPVSFSTDMELYKFDPVLHLEPVNKKIFFLNRETEFPEDNKVFMNTLINFIGEEESGALTDKDRIKWVTNFYALNLNAFELREKEKDLLAIYNEAIDYAREIINNFDFLTEDKWLMLKANTYDIEKIYDFDNQISRIPDLGFDDPAIKQRVYDQNKRNYFCKGKGTKVDILEGYDYDIVANIPECDRAEIKLPTSLAKDFFYNDSIALATVTYKNDKVIKKCGGDIPGKTYCLSVSFDHATFNIINNGVNVYQTPIIFK